MWKKEQGMPMPQGNTKENQVFWPRRIIQQPTSQPKTDPVSDFKTLSDELQKMTSNLHSNKVTFAPSFKATSHFTATSASRQPFQTLDQHYSNLKNEVTGR